MCAYRYYSPLLLAKGLSKPLLTYSPLYCWNLVSTVLLCCLCYYTVYTCLLAFIAVIISLLPCYNICRHRNKALSLPAHRNVFDLDIRAASWSSNRLPVRMESGQPYLDPSDVHGLACRPTGLCVRSGSMHWSDLSEFPMEWCSVRRNPDRVLDLQLPVCLVWSGHDLSTGTHEGAVVEYTCM